jgi:probable F420-dependent oxidoreductase
VKVRFAVSPGALADGGQFTALLDGLEQRGFDTVWLSDVPLGPGLDPLPGLGFAAARTTRLKLGANLVPLGRNTVLLAKQLAQLDRLSGGRLLLALVPGLGDPAERTALGIGGRDRGESLERAIAELRELWAGGAVGGARIDAAPLQDPLELWLGGHGPRALARAGRLADGWLGSALTPAEAGAARQQIEAAAAAAGRVVDPEHFGLSIPYARSEPAPEQLARLAARRPELGDQALASLLPAGATQLRRLIGELVAEGLSKFVLRPAGPQNVNAAELDWLAATVLDLQS